MPGETTKTSRQRVEAADTAPAAPVDVVHMAAVLVSASVVVAALYLGRDVLLPLAVAFLIGFALSPLVTWLGHRGLPRLLNVILVMALVLVVLGGLGVLLTQQARSLSAQLPTYQTTIRGKLSDLREMMQGPGIFDGAIRTVDVVQDEVTTEPAQEIGPPPQKVEVIEPAQSPFKTAIEWLTPAIEPLTTLGIIFVFVFLALLDRRDLRDRLLRLLGGNLHRSTAAIEEAGARISRYLLMQLLVNVSYGIPMALGLWFIGVPGALMWGTLAAVMRFIPYLGPALSAIFPIALAFAVDPGWNMVLMTVALIVFLELVSNNIVEPLLYGTSTGLSALSLIAAATFWTLLWGPVGLILSTPLTVCLLVLGRNLPQMQFLVTLLGSTPALDTPTRIYQRLIADDPEEAVEIATEAIEETSLVDFYDDVGMEVLRHTIADYSRNSTAEFRLRISNGLDDMLEDLREDFPPSPNSAVGPRILCIGGKWELDAVASEMLAHALVHEGMRAEFHGFSATGLRKVAKLELGDVDTIVISYFSDKPAAPARQISRRIRQHWPNVKIVLALWDAPEDMLSKDAHQSLGADALVTTIGEAVARLRRMVKPDEAQAVEAVIAPDNDAERIEILHETGVLDGHAREDLDLLAKRAADVFKVGFAVISAIDGDKEFIIGQSKDLPGARTRDGTDMIVMPRDDAVCNHVVSTGEVMVVDDTERDPRFADHPAVDLWKIRFYAGAPLKTAEGHVLGALCLLDTKPHELTDNETALLETLAGDVVAAITGDEDNEVDVRHPEEETASATVGQKVPN